MKLVKVARVNNKLKEVCLVDSATIADALRAAGITVGTMEEVWLGHVVAQDTSVNAPDKAVLIVEPKKACFASTTRTMPYISLGMRSLIRFLDNEGLIDTEWDEEGENIDFQETYKINKDLISGLISAAKEA